MEAILPSPKIIRLRLQRRAGLSCPLRCASPWRRPPPARARAATPPPSARRSGAPDGRRSGRCGRRAARRTPCPRLPTASTNTLHARGSAISSCRAAATRIGCFTVERCARSVSYRPQRRVPGVALSIRTGTSLTLLGASDLDRSVLSMPVETVSGSWRAVIPVAAWPGSPARARAAPPHARGGGRDLRRERCVHRRGVSPPGAGVRARRVRPRPPRRA